MEFHYRVQTNVVTNVPVLLLSFDKCTNKVMQDADGGRNRMLGVQLGGNSVLVLQFFRKFRTILKGFFSYKILI